MEDLGQFLDCLLFFKEPKHNNLEYYIKYIMFNVIVKYKLLYYYNLYWQG